MPPKKAAKKVEEEDEPADAAPGPSGPTVEELTARIVALEGEKTKEEELRNYMQLERDKINSFWEITKKELEDKKADLRNKEREMEELEERHQVELKVYKQKVKHLLYEHQNNITALKADGEKALNMQQEEFLLREAELHKEKRSLKQEMKEMELAQQEVIRQLKVDQAKELTKLRQEFEQTAKDLQQKYEKKMRNLRDDLELQRKQEVHEIKERKDTHINELMRKHEAAFAEIKDYYNDITHNNLDLIKQLKEDVADMKKKETANEKLMFEVAQENKRLTEPLAKALKEVDDLRRQLANYERDKAILAQTKARLLETEKALRNLEWEHEVFQQRFGALQAERDDLYAKFEASIYEVQQKSGLKSMLLERKLEAMSDVLEKKEAQLGEVLAAANLDSGTLQQLSRKLDEMLEGKNGLIRALQFDAAKAAAQHADLLHKYEVKLSAFGVTPEEIRNMRPKPAPMAPAVAAATGALHTLSVGA